MINKHSLYKFAAGATLAVSVLTLAPGLALASSHREAPLTAADPQIDATDLFAFVSPDKADTVTLIANYIPFEAPYGGPNYFRFGDDVLYEIKIDNTGDGVEDISYQFRFTTKVNNPNTFLYNVGPDNSLTDPNLNVQQTYSVTRIENGQSTVLGSNLTVPPVNIGPKSTPNYESLSNAGVQSLSDGSKAFAGPVDDPFFVDLGAIFDLLTIRKIPGNMGGGVDNLIGYNVHGIALQIPINLLTQGHQKYTDAADPKAVIGVWTTASRQKTKVLATTGAATPTFSDEWVQVSRLGMPLVNEVVVPLGAKDLFNSAKPKDDAALAGPVLDPELGKLFNALYSIKVPPAPRDDIAAAFATGIKGLNQLTTSTVIAEMLRLNTAIAPSSNPNSLGVVGGDNAGFPNGRRLADDVTDIELKVVGGAIYPLFHKDFTPDPLASQLGDGVNANDVPFRSTFPYLGLAQQGFAQGTPSAAAPVQSSSDELNTAVQSLNGVTNTIYTAYNNAVTKINKIMPKKLQIDTIADVPANASETNPLNLNYLVLRLTNLATALNHLVSKLP